MGQCSSKHQVQQPGLVPLRDDGDIGSSATSHGTAGQLAKYLQEHPLSVSSNNKSKRRLSLRDSAAVPVGADMSCSSTANWSASLEMSNNSGFHGSSNNWMERSSRSHSHSNNNMERSSRSLRSQSRNSGSGAEMHLDLSSSHGATQLDPLPEELSMHMQPSSDDTTQTPPALQETPDPTISSKGSTTTPTPTTRKSKSSSSKSKRNSSRMSSSSRRSSNGSSRRRRSSQKAPHPDMDVSANSQLLFRESKKRPRQPKQRSASESAAMPSVQRKQESFRQSLQVTDLDRSKLGTGKDSSWQAMSMTSSSARMYESYESSGLSLGASTTLNLEQSVVGNAMDLARSEKAAMNNLHGFCFTESEDEGDSDTEDETMMMEEGKDADLGDSHTSTTNIHVTVSVEEQ